MVHVVAGPGCITLSFSFADSHRRKKVWLNFGLHGLRSAVQGVIGLCELLLDDPELAGGHRTLVEQARRSGETLLDLVGMVLVSFNHC